MKLIFSCFTCMCHSTIDLHVRHFLHLYLQFFYLNPSEMLLLSLFENKLSAILKLYFRFLFWAFRRHRHNDSAPTYHYFPNWTISDTVMTLYFPRWRPYGGHTVANLLPLSSFVTCHIYKGKKLYAYWILIRYLYPWPRYYYFRLLKTNGRHI